MNRISTIALLTFALFAAWTSAFGQDRVIKANIPFDFTVGDARMPAGEYTISVPFDMVLELRHAGDSAFAIVSSRSHNYANSGSKLVFDRYGDYYFLRHVVCPTVSSLNLDLQQGKAEKRARILEAKLHTAEEVLVAAK
jgi:hypothetical protein